VKAHPFETHLPASDLLLLCGAHKAVGDSMIPLLAHGQDVDFEPCDKHLKIGNCYVFSWQGRNVLHRLVYVNKNHAFFMGDNCPWGEWVLQAKILGRLKTPESLFKRIFPVIIDIFYCLAVKCGFQNRGLHKARKKALQFCIKGGCCYERTL